MGTKPKGAPPKRSGSKGERRGLSWTTMVLISSLLAVVAFFIHTFVYGKDKHLTRGPPVHFPTASNQWGTYRSQLYFGLRAKSPQSPLFGMMWYEQPSRAFMPNVRHVCDQGDGVRSYFWTEADGRTFGKQFLNDSTGLLLKTEWIGHEDTFSVRIIGNTVNKKKRHTVAFYVAKQNFESELSVDETVSISSLRDVIRGTDPVFGDYSIDIDVTAKNWEVSSLSVGKRIDLPRIKDLLLMHTMASETERGLLYQLRQQESISNANFVVVQLNLPADFIIDLAFKSQNNTPPTGPDFDAVLKERSTKFNQKFEESFQLSTKHYSKNELEMGKRALSNMLGSIGFFYGHNKVQVSGSSEIVSYGPHKLLTAVPSRPFFPRGFLWDEGFHNMLIRKFDPDLSLEILVSWLNTMSEDGWIPREMILGSEAESKVPSEFVVQRTDVANPPSLFYVVWKMIDDEEFVKRHSTVLSQIYPKLSKWFLWLRTSQKGPQQGTYRWRGRNSTIDTELNPKTLASGLDDYPRASHPSNQEYHLDLRCWMAIASGVMHKLAEKYGTEAEKNKFAGFLQSDNDFDDLVKRHWSEESGAFVDYGSHSKDVQLKRVVVKKKGQMEEWVWKRVAHEKPSLRLVDDVFGYNSLFPLIARLIPADSVYMKHTLERLSDPNELWSPYGLRSVSKKCVYYAQRNTEHDAPYWRGYIWINLNYLTLSALHHYSMINGPYQNRIQEIFEELRINIVSNMAKQMEVSGYIWENYDDRTGEGRGSHPFTGWSALVLSIMSDQLDN